MAEAKVLSGAGLRGQSAGQTALCTCGVSGAGLTYRGYDIKDLADNAQFEEVAHLLLYGKLPNQAELDAYKARLKGIKPFRSTTDFTASGASAGVVRTTDTIVDLP